MSQDKEYIPEWKQPHIGSEAKKRFISFEAHTIKYHVNIDKINYISANQRNIWIVFYNRTSNITINGQIETIEPLYQSILDQLNQ